MRLKITLFGATLAAVGTAFALAPAASAARECPPGTTARYLQVGSARVGYCVPYQQCDPGPCDPTAAPDH